MLTYAFFKLDAGRLVDRTSGEATCGHSYCHKKTNVKPCHVSFRQERFSVRVDVSEASTLEFCHSDSIMQKNVLQRPRLRNNTILSLFRRRPKTRSSAKLYTVYMSYILTFYANVLWVITQLSKVEVFVLFYLPVFRGS